MDNTIDNDISLCESILEEYPFDYDKLSEVFGRIVLKYVDVISDLTKGLNVYNFYEAKHASNHIYRQNLQILLKNITAFKENGYTNNASAHTACTDMVSSMLFKDASKKTFDAENLSDHEKDEIIEKINEIEDIFNMSMPKSEKWSLLRPYMVWLSGKKHETVIVLLPLIMKIL